MLGFFEGRASLLQVEGATIHLFARPEAGSARRARKLILPLALSVTVQ